MIKAIIFDFDGVLVVSEESRFKALKKAAKTKGISIDEELFSLLVGKTTITFLNEILSDNEKKQIPAVIAILKKDYKDKIEEFVQPIDVTVNFIKHYEGPIRFAIASMSQRHIVEKIVKKFGIHEKIGLITAQEDVNFHKPHPEIYIRTINKLGLKAENCIAIEDTAVGVDSAISGGLNSYVILNGINKQEDFTNKKIKGFIKTIGDLEALV